MKKKGLLITMIFFLTSATIYADDVSIAWQQPDDNRVVGYEVYVDDENIPYDDVGGNLSATIYGLSAGHHWFAAKSYDAEGNRSALSEKLNHFVADWTSLQNFQIFGSNTSVNTSTGVVDATINSTTAPTDYRFEISDLSVTAGQVVKLILEAYYDGASCNAPCSVYLLDEGGNIIGREKVLYIDRYYYTAYEANVIAKATSANCKLVFAFGNTLGQYQFQQIQLNFTWTAVPVVENLYVRNLTTSAIGPYAVVVEWPATNCDNIIVRTAKLRADIESGENCHAVTTLPGSTTSISIDVDTSWLYNSVSRAYDGFFISITAQNAEVEGIPNIIGYLPGNIIGTSEDVPIAANMAVGTDDVNYVNTHQNLAVPTPSGPASQLGLSDTSPDNLVNRRDLTIPTYQQRALKKLSY